MAAPLPLAAGLDWLEGILPLLFLLFWVVSQVRGLFRGADRGPPARPAPARPAARPVIDDRQREELARQIEDFIRRSSGERAPPRAAPRPPEPARGAGAPPQRGPAPAVAPRNRRPKVVPAPAAEPTRPLGSLGGHGADVARHVRDAFAHEIEQLPAGLAGSAGGVAPAAARRSATDLVAMLRDPVALRQMVIVREVLERPVERW